MSRAGLRRGIRCEPDVACRRRIGSLASDESLANVARLQRRRFTEPDDVRTLPHGRIDVFEIPPGHDAWVVGDEPWVSVDFEAMRTYGRAEPTGGRRTLFSVLMTDIVDSTAQAVAHGPAAWRDIVRSH